MTTKQTHTTDPITTTNEPEITSNTKCSLIIECYGYADRTVNHYKGNSANIYVPPSWKGHRVKVILLEPITD